MVNIELLSKEELIDLYINQDLSALKISKIIGCKSSRIKSLLARYSITKRPKKFYKDILDVENDIIKEYLESKNITLIMKKYNTTYHVIRNLLNKHDIKIRGSVVRTINIGEKFGNLEVISIKETKRYRATVYNCKCLCGNIIDVPSHKLISGKKKSCGCLKFVSGENHRDWKGVGEISGNFWSSIRGGARSRGLEFNITIEYIWDLFLKQERKCALTGQNLIIPPTNTYKRDSSQPYASLDRIDSSKGYTEDNVQWVHKDVNIMKMDFSLEYFKNICKMVTEHE